MQHTKVSWGICLVVCILDLTSAVAAKNLKSLVYRRSRSITPPTASTIFSVSGNVNIEILNRLKREKLYFVEGFSFVSSDTLLESTGLNDSSEIHYLHLKDMSITNQLSLPQQIFGEGSVLVYDAVRKEEVVYMMTYKNRIVYKIDKNLKGIIETIDMPKDMLEGWGIAVLDKDTILATDGSNRIFHIDPSTFTVKKIVEVVDKDGRKLQYLNEIEMIDGLLYSNVFLQNNILVVDPHTGEVKDDLDFQFLISDLESHTGYEKYTKINGGNNCLNGIAYNQITKHLLVTGKNWPFIYDIKLTKKI